MGYRVPAQITPEILDLCRQLNATSRPIYLSIAPAPGCEPNDCFMCIRRKVELDGGRLQAGWSIWEWPNAFIRTEHHAVYEPPTGPPWVDITPAETPDVRRRLFLSDDTATYDFENEGIRRDEHFKTLVDDPAVQEYFRLAREKNEIMNSIPGVGLVSLQGDQARQFQQNQHQTAMIEMQLLMKYTPQNAPCFCGGGEKFKRCHGQMRMGRP